MAEKNVVQDPRVVDFPAGDEQLDPLPSSAESRPDVMGVTRRAEALASATAAGTEVPALRLGDRPLPDGEPGGPEEAVRGDEADPLGASLPPGEPGAPEHDGLPQDLVEQENASSPSEPERDVEHPGTAEPEPRTEDLQPSAELKPIVEALIFASPEPLSLKALRKLLASESAEAIHAAVTSLQVDYNDNARGLQVVEVAGGFQIVTRSELHDWVRRLFHERSTQKLSVQALETLAVIAYKQPITAAEITEIRGVNSAGVLGTLIDRHLIKIAGRKPVVGRPFMYATTREFLDRFGLKDLTELPKIEDLADVLGFEPPALQEIASEAPLPFDGETGT